ncbi:protein-tyrosine phosphatase domain-containing protein [Phthorimaea operculella]|nr:protein-tyrosine phosphatase domain-containing protein [Phthorimaea operculella]
MAQSTDFIIKGGSNNILLHVSTFCPWGQFLADENGSISETIPDRPVELKNFPKLCEQRRKFPVLYKLEFQSPDMIRNGSISETIPDRPVELKNFPKLCEQRRKFPVLYKLEFQSPDMVRNGSISETIPDRPVELKNFPKLCEQRRKFPVLYKLEFQSPDMVRNGSISETIPDRPVELKNFPKLCEQRRKFPVLYKLEFQSSDMVRYGLISETIPDRPVELKNFPKLCEQRRKFPVLYKLEFQTAVKVETHSCRHATKKNNAHKNQNQKVIPYDYNRVVLDTIEREPDSDYINASYIDSILKPNAYIVTQGPTEDTVVNFWRMVWQQRAAAIVMLTKTFDFIKVMCVQYWPPNKEKDETYGDISVGIVQEEELANFHIRTFRLYKKEKDVVVEERFILQFHYTQWHSHTCPFSNALLEFRRRVRAVVGRRLATNPAAGPMIVHCNDGGGRSGVYLAIDANLELAEEEDCFDVFGYLKKLRQSRKGLIENEEQYKFVYDTLEEHVVCGVSWFPVAELSQRLKQKSQRDPVTKLNEYQKEYQQICKQTPRFTIGDCAGGHRGDNREKNRDVLVVPPDNFRPYLTSFQGNSFTDYINAVFVDGYTKPREYIVTEWPLIRTQGEFWSLVYDYECAAVVVLCVPPKNSQQFPQFWPEGRHTKKYGPVFTIDHVSHNHYTNIKTWIFRINKKIVSLTELMAGVKAPPKTVQLFQLTCWPMGHKVPSSTNSLVELMNMVERWRQRTDYGPVCVVSPDGRSRAGVYCAANACIEQVIQHGEVDVFQAVKTVRRHRPQLVENMTEYKYCYDLVLHYVLHYLNKDMNEKNHGPRAPSFDEGDVSDEHDEHECSCAHTSLERSGPSADTADEDEFDYEPEFIASPPPEPPPPDPRPPSRGVSSERMLADRREALVHRGPPRAQSQGVFERRLPRIYKIGLMDKSKRASSSALYDQRERSPTEAFYNTTGSTRLSSQELFEKFCSEDFTSLYGREEDRRRRPPHSKSTGSSGSDVRHERPCCRRAPCGSQPALARRHAYHMPRSDRSTDSEDTSPRRSIPRAIPIDDRDENHQLDDCSRSAPLLSPDRFEDRFTFDISERSEVTSNRDETPSDATETRNLTLYEEPHSDRTSICELYDAAFTSRGPSFRHNSSKKRCGHVDLSNLDFRAIDDESPGTSRRASQRSMDDTLRQNSESRSWASDSVFATPEKRAPDTSPSSADTRRYLTAQSDSLRAESAAADSTIADTTVIDDEPNSVIERREYALALKLGRIDLDDDCTSERPASTPAADSSKMSSRPSMHKLEPLSPERLVGGHGSEGDASSVRSKSSVAKRRRGTSEPRRTSRCFPL